MKPCPFCGTIPDLNSEDTIYPNGIVWRFDEELQCKTYHGIRNRQHGDNYCYQLICDCGLELHADSREELVERWENRV